MGRVRMAETALKNWDDVNLSLKEIAECELAIESIEADMNNKISDLKLEKEMEAKPLQERIDKLAREIKEYVETNRDELKGKTRVLNFGKTGFRQSTSIIIKGVQGVLKSLKAKGMTDCIIVKESVNKDRLREYPDEVIASVGATKRVTDTFWYEADREKLRV